MDQQGVQFGSLKSLKTHRRRALLFGDFALCFAPGSFVLCKNALVDLSGCLNCKFNLSQSSELLSG